MSASSNVSAWTKPLVLIAFFAPVVAAETQTNQETQLRRLPSTDTSAVRASSDPFVLTANPDQDRSLLIETPAQERSLTEAEEELLWTRVKRRGAKSFNDKIYRVGNAPTQQKAPSQSMPQPQPQVAKRKPVAPRPPVLSQKVVDPALKNGGQAAPSEVSDIEPEQEESVRVAAKETANKTQAEEPAVETLEAPALETTEPQLAEKTEQPIETPAEEPAVEQPKVAKEKIEEPVVERVAQAPVAVQRTEEVVVETPMTTETETYTTVIPAPTQGFTAQDTQVEGVGYNSFGCGDVGCCDTGCCAECCQPVCCCPPPVCRPTFWVGGVEATFLAADFNNDGVTYLLEDNIAAPPVNVPFGSEDTSDLESLYIAPRLWLGIQRCNCGLVARYWHMRAHNNSYDPFIFAPGAFEGIQDVGFFTFNNLDLYTTDIEGTYSFCCCRSKHTLSFGARYADADHTAGLDTLADVNNGSGGNGLISGGAYMSREFSGTGITGGWQGRKPLFCGSCIHLFAGLRGSVIWGDSELISETRVTAQTPGGGAASSNIAILTEDETLFIGEVQLGLEWDYRVKCFPADAFFRVVAEYQYWDCGDGSTFATSFAEFGTSPSNSRGTATSSAQAFELDLYGFSVATGFTW